MFENPFITYEFVNSLCPKIALEWESKWLKKMIFYSSNMFISIWYFHELNTILLPKRHVHGW